MYVLILKRERKGEEERERDKHRFVVPLIYALIGGSCMCPDWGANPQPRRIGTTLQPTEPGLGTLSKSLKNSIPKTTLHEH